MKALVTGGAGFIGSHITKRLVDEGWEVTVVDDLSNGHKEFLDGLDIKFLRMDFADQIVLHLCANGEFDYVFHEAAVPRVSYSVEHPSETTDVNINRTVKLMAACQRSSKAKSQVKRFIFASSSSVYGGADTMPTPETHPKSPVSPYALQKSVIEEYCKLFHHLYGFDSVCLRYFNVFGPNQYGNSPYSTAVSAWCDALKHGKELRSDGDGEQTRDMCYVDNVVEANWLAANCPVEFAGDSYNVACGDRTSNNEILEYLKQKYPKLVVRHAPERAGDVKHTCASVHKASRIFGYEPKVRFWEGLQKTMEWWNL